MYQKQISQLVGEISSLAVQVNLAKKAIVWVDYQGHVDLIRVHISDKDDWRKKVVEKEVWFEGGSFNLNRDRYEAEALQSLHEIKVTIEKYLGVNPFQSVWEKYQNEIEAEIVDCINRGRSYTEEQLFHDVMIETTGHEISLDCVYQSLKLSNGEEYASLFKKEILDNIQWLDQMVHMSGDEREVV